MDKEREEMLEAIRSAESFISGFEDDDAQDDDVNEILTKLRRFLPA